MSAAPRTPRHPSSDEAGVALIMVVIFSVLLSVLVMELVTTARQAAATSDNDVITMLMGNHMENVLPEVLQQLSDDLTAGGEEGAAAPGGEGPGANPLGAAAPGGEGGPGGEETPPSDSFNDAHLKPQAFADGKLTTYVLIEDENRKFNILSLLSPDDEFARESRERLIRLIRGLRESTPFEISSSRAETIATAITGWLKGEDRNDNFRPQPKLKSDDEAEPRRTIPLHLDELLLLREVDADIFYDKVWDGPPLQVIPGLSSVLTIYTSYRKDPGDPEKQARNNPNSPSSGSNNNNNPGGANPGGNEGQGAKTQPEGIGIRININTAPRAVLRCLFGQGQIPDRVIEAIIEYRNEELPEEENAELEEIGSPSDIEEGLETPRQIFNSLEDLEKVPEFANLADKDVKEKFLNLLTVESDVYTVHMACLYKRSEERKIFVINRRRSVFVRLEGDEEPRLHPLVRMERYQGRRVFLEDLLENETDTEMRIDEMDDFSAEERKWNPFYKEFYKHALDKKQ